MNLARIADSHPGRWVALLSPTGPTTHAELRDQVAQARAALAAHGLERGAVVAVLGGNTEAFVVSYLAALGLGLVATPLHPRNPAAELDREVRAVGADLLLITDDDAAEVGAAVAALGRAEPIAARRLRDLLAEHPHAPDQPIADVDPHDAAVLLFTSGTAGEPKPAVLSHGNLMANLDQLDAHPGELVAEGDVLLGVLPITHILGLNSMLAYALHSGATLALIDDFTAESVLGAITEFGIDALLAPPVFWGGLAAADIDPSIFSGVRQALSGAAPLPVSVATAVEAKYGLLVRQGYGLTEASPGLTLAHGTDAPPNSVGRPLPGVELRLVDEHGADVLVGDVGEVLARGANIFSRYLNDPEASAAAVDEAGWLHTGDLAVVDEQGYLYIVGRSKDLIIVSGFNVYPGEVERVMRSHRSVVQVAVVGEPDERRGEAVVAYVVAGAAVDVSRAASELIDHCRSLLAGYKCPSRVEFVDALPRGIGGKVQRRRLAGS